MPVSDWCEGTDHVVVQVHIATALKLPLLLQRMLTTTPRTYYVVTTMAFPVLQDRLGKFRLHHLPDGVQVAPHLQGCTAPLDATAGPGPRPHGICTCTAQHSMAAVHHSRHMQPCGGAGNNTSAVVSTLSCQHFPVNSANPEGMCEQSSTLRRSCYTL